MITQTRSYRGTESTHPGLESLDVRLERLANYAQTAHEPKRPWDWLWDRLHTDAGD